MRCGFKIRPEKETVVKGDTLRQNGIHNRHQRHTGRRTYTPLTQVYKEERRFTEKTLKVLGFGFYVALLFYEKKESELLNDKVRSSYAFCQRGDEP